MLGEGLFCACPFGQHTLLLILECLGGNRICQKYGILRNKACSVTDTALNTTINRNPWLSLEEMSATCRRSFYYSRPSSFLAIVGLCEYGLLRSCALLNELQKTRLDFQAFKRQNALKDVCYPWQNGGKAAKLWKGLQITSSMRTFFPLHWIWSQKMWQKLLVKTPTAYVK